MNILLVPWFYFNAFRNKHLERKLSKYKPRPTFNECLEFYPVTRRAWNRALAIREKEMEIIKSKVGEEHLAHV
jgi:hypothetical protein